LDKLINMSDIGITLTENGAMTPTSSIAGLYFSHPKSTYFLIGKISEEQLQDYALRCGESTENLRKFLAKNLK